MSNYYDLLGVQKNVSYADLKSTYRKLAIKYHPDKNPGDKLSEERFKKINTAYQILSSPAKRSRYDSTLEYQEFAAQQRKQQATQSQYKAQPNGGYSPPPPPDFGKAFRSAQEREDAIWKNSWRNLTPKKFKLVFGVVLLIVFGIIGIANYVQIVQDQKAQQAREEKALFVANNKVAIEAALLATDYNSVFKSLEILGFNNKDYSYILYKEKVQDRILVKSKRAIVDQKYDLALKGLQVLQNKTHSKFNKYQKFEIMYLIGYTYHLMNDNEKALAVLEPINNKRYPEIATLVALIYRENKQDVEKAILWHGHAKKILHRLYQNAGFDFVPEDAPDPHFEAYYQSAFTNYSIREFKAAIDDLKGALFLRSSSRDALYMLAMCERELGMDNACESIRLAKKYGYPISDFEIIEFCK